MRNCMFKIAKLAAFSRKNIFVVNRLNRALSCTHLDELASGLIETGILEDSLQTPSGVWTGTKSGHDKTPKPFC